MKLRFLGLSAVTLALLTGVGRGDGTSPALKPLASATPVAATRPVPPPVAPHERLVTFLPETPAGWTAENPSGSTTEISGFNLSTATRTYEKGNDENAAVATVTIIDAGGHKGYFETTTSAWKFLLETPAGYDRVVEIDGVPGYEHYSKAAHSSSLCVIAGKRYFVQIELTNQDPKELREWLRKIDLKKLAELKQ